MGWLGRLVLLLPVAVVLASGYGTGHRLQEKKKCHHTRSHGMLSADCHGLDLTSIPQDLQQDIKVLSMTYNRLRELSCDSFDRYSSLGYLYLNDNLLSAIPEGIFTNLPTLEVVDLSLNALKIIPHDLLTLSHLRKLYVDHNPLDENGLQSLKNVTGSVNVQYLSLAGTGLRTLPPMNKFLELTFLNVSGNGLHSVGPQEVAAACSLRSLDLSLNERLFSNNYCGCRRLETYLVESNVSLVAPFMLNCTQKPEQDSCNGTEEEQVHETYESCRYQKAMIMSKSNGPGFWMIFASTVGGLLVLVLIASAIYCKFYRQTAREDNNLNRPQGSNHADQQPGPDSETYPLKDRGFNINT